MDTRSEKLARVGRLRSRLPYMTHTALAAVLAAAQEEPLPDVTRRGDIREARSRLANSETPYGSVHVKVDVPTVRGAAIGVEVCSPWPMLFRVCSVSAGFSTLLRQVMARIGPSSPSRPYKICLYSDEVTPGDQIMGKHRRKFQAVYWSILALGPAALSLEENWFTVCTMRSTLVQTMVGGMSGLVAALLKHQFMGPFDPTRAGILIQLHGSDTPVRFFFEFDILTGDELSIQQINCTRGASAEMPCMFGMNVKSKWSLDIEHDASGYFVSSRDGHV